MPIYWKFPSRQLSKQMTPNVLSNAANMQLAFLVALVNKGCILAAQMTQAGKAPWHKLHAVMQWSADVDAGTASCCQWLLQDASTRK